MGQQGIRKDYDAPGHDLGLIRWILNEHEEQMTEHYEARRTNLQTWGAIIKHIIKITKQLQHIYKIHIYIYIYIYI